jgi:hypothetical protein
MNGVEMITAERQRQIYAEGWTPEHDAGHEPEALARAAVCYAVPPDGSRQHIVNVHWPWRRQFWKPTPDDRIRELTKAGALIAAEIDRLQGGA